jgi:hypothetical protein
MLDPQRPVSLPGVPGFAVYADDRLPDRFYAWPSVPDVARDPDGAPELSLLLYGRKQDGRLVTTGGYLTVTTRLALSEAESATLKTALQERLRAERDLPPDAPVEVEVAAPTWTSGDVELQLADDVVLRGTPSLIGENRTAMTATLEPAVAEALRSALDRGLDRSTIHYRMTAQAASTSALSGASHSKVETQGQGYDSRANVRSEARVETTTPVPFSVEASGPLHVTPAETRAATQEIGL